MEYIKLKLKDKSAQDMVEFSFVLPLLLLCFVFILTGGQLIYNKFVTFDAAFNSIRAACTEPNIKAARDTMGNVANEFIEQGISVKKVKTVLNPGYTNATWHKNLEIEGSVTFEVKTLFPLQFQGFKADNTYDVTSTSVAYVEYDTSLPY